MSDDHLERRLTALANRVEYLIGQVLALREITNDLAIHVSGTVEHGVTHNGGTMHAQGTGRLGGSRSRKLSDDAIAALAALDDD